ncbi:MAG: hypothetical protein KDK34_09500, partial [Leptospiraceae bacterium]|nr:hypothetical protein [Leptospiraceae bacterium]
VYAGSFAQQEHEPTAANPAAAEEADKEPAGIVARYMLSLRGVYFTGNVLIALAVLLAVLTFLIRASRSGKGYTEPDLTAANT